jgi:hypothetical protein
MLLNSLTKEIWEWCISKNIWISAYHIPGTLNDRADALSRQKLTVDMEWSLDIEVFNKIIKIYGCFDIDMFASKWNNKLNTYASFGNLGSVSLRIVVQRQSALSQFFSRAIS